MIKDESTREDAVVLQKHFFLSNLKDMVHAREEGDDKVYSHLK